MARKTLTDTGVAALKPRDKTYAHPDPQCPGHYVRVTPIGSKSFVAVTRDQNKKQKWYMLGNAAHNEGIATCQQALQEDQDAAGSSSSSSNRISSTSRY